MENTAKVLFEGDNQPQWYIALGDKWVGPLTASDVYEKVVAQEISWAHFVWKPGQADWKRICDIKTFQAAVPMPPNKQVLPQVEQSVQAEKTKTLTKKTKTQSPPPGPSEDEVRDWFLHYNDCQFGPFSESEVVRYLIVGKITPRVHAWRDGMEDWVRIEKLDPLYQAFQKSVDARQPSPPKAPKADRGGPPARPSAKEKDSDKRTAPRKPLVARILVSNDSTVAVCICRDVSMGGMQVLTDHVPGTAGTRIKMNVSPASAKKSGGKGGVQPFVAEGVIVRVLEDGRGFSFRFEKLDENAKRAIETHIKSAE